MPGFTKIRQNIRIGFRAMLLLLLCMLIPGGNAAAQADKIDWEYYCIVQRSCPLYDPNFDGCGDTGVTPPTAIAPNAAQEANARSVIGVAKTLNIGQQGALIGLMVALAESGLKNYASDAQIKYPEKYEGIQVSQENPVWQALPEPRPIGHDQESVGVFQQRVTMGWSTLAAGPDAVKNKAAIWQLMNPVYAAQAFFGSPPGANMPPAVSKGLQNKSGWQSMAPQLAAQAVQGSFDSTGSNYLAQKLEAQAILDKYWESTQPVLLVIPMNSGVGGGTGDTATTNPNDCGAIVNINCTPSGDAAATPTTGSSVRSAIVCLAQAEYKLWQDGQMKPGTDFYKYSHGVGEEWCADFVSWIYNKAGIPLTPGGEGKVAAVRSIYMIGNNNPQFEYHPSNSGYTPKPGDLAIHSSAGSAFYHVNMVTAVAGSKVTIIGGNQGGTAFTNSKVTSYDMNSFTDEDTIGYVGPK